MNIYPLAKHFIKQLQHQQRTQTLGLHDLQVFDLVQSFFNPLRNPLHATQPPTRTLTVHLNELLLFSHLPVSIYNAHQLSDHLHNLARAHLIDIESLSKKKLRITLR